MNATETIAAAIEVLEHEGEPWGYVKGIETIYDVNGVLVAENVLPRDGERIVRWSRTIDAQLAILRRHMDLARAIGESYPVSYEDFGVLDLARAILGEAS